MSGSLSTVTFFKPAFIPANTFSWQLAYILNDAHKICSEHMKGVLKTSQVGTVVTLMLSAVTFLKSWLFKSTTSDVAQ